MRKAPDERLHLGDKESAPEPEPTALARTVMRSRHHEER
jgi:hypothetical protein